MRIQDINPFVRISLLYKRTPANKFVINPDCRLFYIIEGQGNIIIDGKEYSIQNDTLILLPSATTYKWNIAKTNKKSIAILNFDYTMKYSHKKTFLRLLSPNVTDDGKIFKNEEFEDAKILNSPIYIKHGYKYKTAIIEMIEEFEEKKEFFYEKLNVMLKQLIIDIVRQISKPSIPPKIEYLMEYVNKNYNLNVSNEELAKLTSYHPNYINRLMKEYVGITLHSYVIQCRMNNAHNLIINTNKPIEEIAYETGFKNCTHFYKIFRQIYGISPSGCRKISKTI